MNKPFPYAVSVVLAALMSISAGAEITWQNIAGTKGLTPEIIAEAQKLSDELSEAKDLLVPLDKFLKGEKK